MEDATPKDMYLQWNDVMSYEMLLMIWNVYLGNDVLILLKDAYVNTDDLENVPTKDVSV